MKELYLEGNNGGTALVIQELPDQMVRVDLGHDCVHVGEWEMPVFVLGMFLAKFFTEENLQDMQQECDFGNFGEKEFSRVKNLR